jgi:hypothetical protein
MRSAIAKNFSLAPAGYKQKNLEGRYRSERRPAANERRQNANAERM